MPHQGRSRGRKRQLVRVRVGDQKLAEMEDRELVEGELGQMKEIGKPRAVVVKVVLLREDRPVAYDIAASSRNQCLRMH